MIVGIVQQLVGHVGGNDKVLEALFEVFKDDEIHLFTLSACSNITSMTKDSSNITVLDFPTTEVPIRLTDYSKPVIHTKIPVHIPLLGIYQKFIMSIFEFISFKIKHIDEYSNCDIVISTTGYSAKTNKKLIIYDQNNLGNEFNNITPLKYQKGLWKLYYLPFRIFNRPKQVKDAKYISNSEYSSTELFNASGIKSSVIYPSVHVNEFYELPKVSQICVVGRISPEKNLENTIDILNCINHKCIIFGNVTLSNKRYFEKLKNKAKSHIVFLDNLPREKLLELMAESKVIFSSSKETFGITTVEGIASGCIPIVPNNSAHPEIVIDSTLRYDTNDEAVRTLNRVMSEDYNIDMEPLKQHIKNFSFENFVKRVREECKS